MTAPVAIRRERGAKRPAFQIWPGFMSLDIAAAYCSMSGREFLQAVGGGDLPQPVLMSGKERWRLADIDAMFDQKDKKKWQMSD